MKKFQSRVKIKVKGLNQERAFNKLTKEVQILKLEREDKHICRLEVSPKDAKKTRKFLRNNNFEILSEESFGSYKWGKWFLSCYGIIIGLVLCFGAYIGQKSFIWQVKVYGNNLVKTEEITSIIDENLASRFIPQINTKEMEVLLKDSFDRISSVSVAIIGQSLVVNINEGVLPDEMTGKFAPIVCEYDCMVKEIRLIQGTLRVKEGDIVRAGEVLVEPYIYDADGQKRDVKPMAEIKADVWLVGTSEHSDSFYKTYRTGRKVEESKVTLFGLVIYSNNAMLPFKEYEIESTTQNLVNNNLLPFKVEKNTYYETKTELIEKNFEEVKEEIIASARQKALQNYTEYEIIKDENYTITEAGGVSVVTYVVTIEREIAGGFNAN